MDGGIATSDVNVPRESVGRNEQRLLADADHLIAVTKTVPVPGTPTVPVPGTPTVPGSIPVPITPTVPGSVPVPGAPTVHKTVPRTVPETVPGTVQKTVTETVPGRVPVPETVPETVPGTVTPSGILAVGNRCIARVAVPVASTHSSTRTLSIGSVERVPRAGRVWI